MADIGGYLGLFLGLSVYGLVDLTGNFYSSFKERRASRKKVEDENVVGPSQYFAP